MTKCPYCGYEADLSEFKLLREPWRFRFYEVRMLSCPRCGGVFNYYIGRSPRSGRMSEFYVRIRPRPSKKEAKIQVE